MYMVALYNYALSFRKVGLPKTDGTFGLEYLDGDTTDLLSNRPTTGHDSITLTRTAIAGMVGAGRGKFILGM